MIQISPGFGGEPSTCQGYARLGAQARARIEGKSAVSAAKMAIYLRIGVLVAEGLARPRELALQRM